MSVNSISNYLKVKEQGERKELRVVEQVQMCKEDPRIQTFYHSPFPPYKGFWPIQHQ